jgi:hypothetical protein
MEDKAREVDINLMGEVALGLLAEGLGVDWRQRFRLRLLGLRQSSYREFRVRRTFA